MTTEIAGLSSEIALRHRASNVQLSIAFPLTLMKENTMKAVTLPLALAISAFTLMTSNVYAEELDRIAIDPPVVKVVGRDEVTEAPIENVTVVARVIPDPETLTTDSGIALLNDNVREAARTACFKADPMTPDDGTCYRKAMASAKQQMAALIAHAKEAQATGTKVAANN
jgi:UrcA family protein